MLTVIKVADWVLVLVLLAASSACAWVAHQGHPMAYAPSALFVVAAALLVWWRVKQAVS